MSAVNSAPPVAAGIRAADAVPVSAVVGGVAFGARDGWRYGLLGLPLAFVALPLYVLLPNHYAREFGLPLATLGAVLLGARLLDAVTDPLIGRWCDHWFAAGSGRVLGAAAVAAVALALGFWLLFFPLVQTPDALALWALALLVWTYLGYSVLSVAHQAWGARLGGDASHRARVVAWREALGLAGVLLASVLPALLGLGPTVALFWVLLLAGWLAWSRAPRPAAPAEPAAAREAAQPGRDPWLPFRRSGFRRLLAVFVLNGIASAIPATLVLFFVQDRLQAPAAIEPAFLASYFLCAALSIPLWLRLVARLGLARTWAVGMVLAIAVFVWTTTLGAGDVVPFLVVCALSGLALGTDLALPGAMLAGVIGAAGDRGRADGTYFGWWNFSAKLNLALAAGLALPLLALAGYAPGAREPAALQALTVAYCLLPCLLKLGALALLWLSVIRPEVPT